MKARTRRIAAVAFTLAIGVAGAYQLGPRLYNRQRLSPLLGRRVYDEKADARVLFDRALAEANQGHKRLLVVLGGNWCPWCLVLDALMHENASLRDYLSERFVVLKLDNQAARPLDELWGKPTRHGVPVLIFVDQQGTPVHIQDSGSLELWHGRILGHDAGKLLAVLKRFG